MKKAYSVTLSRDDYYLVVVKAEDEKQAKEYATEAVCQSEDPWEEYGDWSEGFRVVEVNEEES